MTYTIGEMAKRLNISPSALRYYDKEGLLPFIKRSESGIRIFTDEDYGSLKLIHCLKSSGMQIKDIREFMALVIQGDETIGARLELFQKRRDELEQQMHNLEETLAMINYKCWYYETAKALGSTAAVNSLPDEAVPMELRSIKAKLKSE